MHERDLANLNEMVLRYNESIIRRGSEKPKFISRFSCSNSDLRERVANMKWFSNCAGASSVETTMPIRFVDDLSDAQQICSRFDWENIKIDAGNQLSTWLNQNCNDEFQKWNDFAIKNNEYINSFIGAAIKPKLAKLNLDQEIAKHVRWDLQAAFIANDYLFTDHTCFFSFELLNVYDYGHIPCGWVGDWPEGYLVAH